MNTKVLKVSQCYSVKRDDNIHFSLFVWMSGAAAAALSGSVIFKDVCEMVKKKKNQITESKCTNRLFLSFLFHLQILEVCLVLSAFLQSSFKCLHWTVAEYFSLSLSLSLFEYVWHLQCSCICVCVCVLGGDIEWRGTGWQQLLRSRHGYRRPGNNVELRSLRCVLKDWVDFPRSTYMYMLTHAHTHTNTHTHSTLVTVVQSDSLMIHNRILFFRSSSDPSLD